MAGKRKPSRLLAPLGAVAPRVQLVGAPARAGSCHRADRHPAGHLPARPALRDGQRHDVRWRALGERVQRGAVAHSLLEREGARRGRRPCRRRARRRRTARHHSAALQLIADVPHAGAAGIRHRALPLPSPSSGWNSGRRTRSRETRGLPARRARRTPCARPAGPLDRQGRPASCRPRPRPRPSNRGPASPCRRRLRRAWPPAPCGQPRAPRGCAPPPRHRRRSALTPPPRRSGQPALEEVRGGPRSRCRPPPLRSASLVVSRSSCCPPVPSFPRSASANTRARAACSSPSPRRQA